MRGTARGSYWTGSVFGLACVLAISAAAFGQTSPRQILQENFDRVVPLAPGGTLILENANGPVTVTGWDRDAVEIHAVKSTDGSALNLGAVRIAVKATPKSVEVDTVGASEDQSEVSVAYTVRVPRHVYLQEVATVNGTVRVTGVANATGSLHSVNGDIEVLDSAGNLSARTTNGDIRLELDKLADSNPVALETVNGSIAIALPSDARATLDVRCLNGSFHSDLPVAFLGAYTPRVIHGKLGGGGVTMQMRTINGAIQILSLAHVV